MNNPQLPPVDAPVGEISRHIAELMRLHPNVHDAVINAMRTIHPLDLHTLQFLRKKFQESNLRHQHPKGPDFEQGENYAFARIDEVLANAIEQAGGPEVKPEPVPEIPWNKLPDWVQWVAMDADKKWYLYSLEPSKKETKWWPQDIENGICTNCVSLIPFTAPDWRTSLRQRPKPTDQ